MKIHQVINDSISIFTLYSYADFCMCIKSSLLTMRTAIYLTVLNYNIPSDGEIKRPPVDDISRGKIQVASKPLDLTSREDIVPHMDISDHPYK